MNLENYGIIFYINEIICHMIYSARIQILLASSLGNVRRTEWRICILMLTLCTLTSVCIFSILFSIHFLGANEENLFNNQELLQLVIIFCILVTSMCDSGVIQRGEIRCLSLLGCKGFYFYKLFSCKLTNERANNCATQCKQKQNVNSPSADFILTCSSMISSCVIASSLATFSLWISSTASSFKVFLSEPCARPSPEIKEDFWYFTGQEPAWVTLTSSIVFCKLSFWCFGTPNVTVPDAANCWANKLFLLWEMVSFDDTFCNKDHIQ